MTKISAWIGLLWLAVSGAQAGELEDRHRLEQQATSLFAQEKFKELSLLAHEYRVKESRTSSGLWFLTLYYAGLSGAINAADDDRRWDAVGKKIQKWISLHPDSPAAHNTYADYLVGRAWRHRGTGWARDVRKEDWAPFYRNLAEAREHLERHKPTTAIDPRWYELMLTIARDEGWERDRFDALVHEAIGRHPRFYQIYFAALDYLVPRWHGNRQEIEKFAGMATEHTQQVEGTGMYARIYWYASQTEYGNELFRKSSVEWDRMKRGIDDVLARYPDQWNIQNFARFACLAGDKEKTKELMARVQGEPIRRAWHGDLNLFSACKAGQTGLRTKSEEWRTKRKPPAPAPPPAPLESPGSR